MKSKRKVILILFFISGISGLMYEVVWLRMFSRFMGVTSYAISTVLAAFMAGLALGSFIFGRYVDKKQKPLQIFAGLQLGIVVMAGIIPFLLQALIPFYKYVYIISGSSAALVVIVRTVAMFICILIPATLMGGTLPVLTSYLVRKGKSLGTNLSLLYGINTAGAVLGVLLSGFITLGLWGEWATIFIGMGLNLIVAIVAGILALGEKGLLPLPETTEVSQRAGQDDIVSPYSALIRRVVLVVFFISGFTAMAYEVIWFRQLILFLKTSIYAFSAMMGVFLTGIALGSIAANFVIDKLKSPLKNFGALEILVGIITIINLYLVVYFDKSLPLLGALSILSATVILIFPLTFLFGAIFPIGTLCYVKSLRQVGSSVGKVYAFNTVGNIFGSLLAGFFFIAVWGSANSLLFLGVINVIMGLVLVWLQPGHSLRARWGYLLVVPLVVFMVLGLKQRDPFLQIIEQRIERRGSVTRKIFYNKEGLEGTVTCFGPPERPNHLWINGIGMTTLGTFTKLMIHLPIMLTEDPREVLVICFGMGTTVRSACIYDDLNVTSVELVPDVYECFPYYYSDAIEVMNRSNYQPVVGDGRNFLLLTDKKFDVISIDPSPPIYSAGTVNLYTKEFLTLCREHLNPDGVMCLWFPVATSDEILAVLKTFYTVFPNMNVWCMQDSGIYIIGKLKPINVDEEKIKRAFANPKLINDLSEFDNQCVSSEQLLSYFILNDKEVEAMAGNAPVISDDFPYTEFPLWRYLNKEPSPALKDRKIMIK